jgi:hypothetical protein
VYNEPSKEKLGNSGIWLNIDPSKVKQRIDSITRRLERVRHQFDPQIETDDSIAQITQQKSSSLDKLSS